MDPSTDVIENQGLFSDYYLENVFGDRPDIEDVFERADEALIRAKDIYDREKQRLAGTKEGQTEKRFIRPILDKVLGWDFIVQETVQGQKSFGEPDYALFSTSETYDKASEEASDGNRERVFRRATALAEAKQWDLSLDGKGDAAGEGDAPSQGTPGAQLLRYFQWTQVPWGILTSGNKWRLYTSRVPSPVDTYLEFDFGRILEQPPGTSEEPTEAREAFRLFYALFRGRSFREDPTLGQSFIESVSEESVEQGEELEEELTERVFDDVFLKLATGLYEDWHEEEEGPPSEEVLDEIYNATLRLLYRLLFLLYAEERNLLPVRDRKGYYRFSLTRLARDAREEVHDDYVLVEDNLWEDLTRLFGIINTGEPDLNVPTYNGHLFDVGTGDNAWLDRHTVPDEYLAPALVDLTLLDPDDPDSRGVDYKALDVRQLGSIYEGLLEHRLRHADQDLAVVKNNGTEVYTPLSDAETPVEVVEQGALYLETDASERKKTGSYYTPHYVVEYIVENTLEPILDERIDQFEAAVEKINEIATGRDPETPGVKAKLDKHRRRARDALLTIRVCDPAMGSGHFLVHAVDYLTNQIGAAVLERDLKINPIQEHLDEIRGEILDSLDEQGVQLDDAEGRLDDFTLLKRLVMKRCIYGVDLNPMAVELAKLSLWLRSFTVGAPLSFLDHHLKPGNSLIGTTVDEVRDALEAEGGQFEVFGGPFAGLLQATELMQEVAQLSDATVDEVRESAERFAEYRDAMHPYKRVLDLWVSRHFGTERAEYLLRQFGTQVLDVFRGRADPADETQRETLAEAAALGDSKSFFHWELEFPEVYYDLDRTTKKPNPGFDAVIGNPPYDVLIRSEQDIRFIEYVNSNFFAAQYNPNLYALFFEHAVEVAKEGGRVGQIVQNSWLTQDTFSNLRQLVAEQTEIATIRDLRFSAFDEIVPTSILIAESKNPREEATLTVGVYTGEREIPTADREVDHSDLQESADIGFEDYLTDQPPIASGPDTTELEDLFTVYRGIETRDNSKYLSETKETSEHEPILNASDVGAYSTEWGGEYVYFVPEELKSNADIEMYDVEAKVLLHRTGDRLIAGVDKVQMLALKNLYLLLPNTEHTADFLCACLNSSLLGWERQRITRDEGETFAQLKGTQVARLPIRKIDFTTPEDEREQHVEALIRDYEEARRSAPPPADTAVLDAVEEHLNADPGSPDPRPERAQSGTGPERADIIHDLLAYLAREMTQLKEARQDLERAFDPFKYLPRGASATPFSEAFSDEIKYAELVQSPVDVTQAQHSIDDARLVEADGTWVLEVRLKK